MPEGMAATPTSVPETRREATNWLRMLAREVNTYALLLHTWSAMGFVVGPEAMEALLGFQVTVEEARKALAKGEGDDLGSLTDDLATLAEEEAALYRVLSNEIERFREETEDLLPASKLNFDPCF